MKGKHWMKVEEWFESWTGYKSLTRNERRAVNES